MGETRNANRIVVWKLVRKYPLGRQVKRSDVNTNMGHRETGCENET